MKIYQHVDELNEHDGIGNDILGFHSIFNELGFNSEIITRVNRSKMHCEIHSSFDQTKFSNEDIHILHYGGAGYSLDFFESILGRKILRFHNMTPVSFFKEYLTDDIFKTFDKNEIKSFLELYSLHSSLSYVLHDSNYNQEEYLKIVGNQTKTKMEVIPVIRNYSRKQRTKISRYRIGFLGRWAPNKKIEELIFTLYFLRKINPEYKLILLGKKNSIFASYISKLSGLIFELGLKNSIEIYEDITDEEINEQLSSLDLYLSMSEHEGFGIPILEAMSFNIPIVAFASSALMETIQDAGILFTKKEFPLIAELIHKIITSPSLKATILSSQKKRFDKYNAFPFREKLLKIIQSNY